MIMIPNLLFFWVFDDHPANGKALRIIYDLSLPDRSREMKKDEMK